MGSSCFSRGNKIALGIIRQYLRDRGLEDAVVFKGSHCFGQCDKGPVLTIGETKHLRADPAQVTELLDTHLGA